MSDDKMMSEDSVAEVARQAFENGRKKGAQDAARTILNMVLSQKASIRLNWTASGHEQSVIEGRAKIAQLDELEQLIKAYYNIP